MAQKVNYILEQGSTFIQMTQGVHKDGSNFDLTDYTLAGQIRGTFSGSVVDAFNVTVTGSAVDGRIVIQLTASSSAEIPAGRYVYDVEIASGSVVKRWQEGEILCSPEVTRA